MKGASWRKVKTKGGGGREGMGMNMSMNECLETRAARVGRDSKEAILK
jgi:hypothetical protein